MAKKHIFVIHGGSAHRTQASFIKSIEGTNYQLGYRRRGDWKQNLWRELGESEEYGVYNPEFPCRENARFKPWAAVLERHLDLLNEGAVLIGHSLGGIFLKKWILQNGLPDKIGKVFLVAATHQGSNPNATIHTFTLPKEDSKFKRLADLGNRVVLIHSEDDEVVPFADHLECARVLPNAEQLVLKDKGHIRMRKFPELAEMIHKHFA